MFCNVNIIVVFFGLGLCCLHTIAMTIKELTPLCLANDGIMYLGSCIRIHINTTSVMTWDEAMASCQILGMPGGHGVWWCSRHMSEAIGLFLSEKFEAAGSPAGHVYTGIRRLDTTGSTGEGFYYVGKEGDGSDIRIGPSSNQESNNITFTHNYLWDYLY